MVTLNQGGKPRRVTTQRAALLCLMEKALGKDVRALDKLLALAATANGSAAEETPESLSADDQAILDAYERDILARAAAPLQRDDEDDDT